MSPGASSSRSPKPWHWAISSETIRFVEQLRELGCDVAIDDFGAGYTSFRNLRAMPVDILKLDGTFCSNLSNNQDNQYFVRSLIDLARTFGMKTVAEWVENEEDAALLREWKVDLMQGNLFGEAQLDPPWHESIDAETFQPEDAVAFVLPSEIAWLESEHETAIAPDDSAMPETSPANDETFDEDEVFAFDAPQPAMTEAIDEPGPEIQRSEVEYLEAQEPEVQQLDAVADATDEIAAVIDEPANIEAAAEVMAQVDVEMVDEIEMTASTPHEALPPASDTVEVFEEGLESELAKLRSAIAALDRAFKPREEPEASEPSFADLVSDTAMQEAG